MSPTEQTRLLKEIKALKQQTSQVCETFSDLSKNLSRLEDKVSHNYKPEKHYKAESYDEIDEMMKEFVESN